MKKAICSVCERKYWAQTIAYGPTFQIKDWDNKLKDRRATKPKTDNCKKHAPPTKIYPKTAKHHFSKDIKRRTNRRSRLSFDPKKQRREENATSER